MWKVISTIVTQKVIAMTNRVRWTLGIGGSCLVFAALGIYLIVQQDVRAERRPRVKRQQFAFDPTDYRPREVVNPYPAIVKPPHVTAEEANRRLQPNELVLGVEIDGTARAYPINRLTGPSREIFNDQLGTHAIAATW